MGSQAHTVGVTHNAGGGKGTTCTDSSSVAAVSLSTTKGHLVRSSALEVAAQNVYDVHVYVVRISPGE